jgi:aspartate-semialdehyde dehydrogenase
MKKIAVLGATGMVGREVLKILDQRNFPVQELFLFASERSEGMTVNFRDQDVEVRAEYESFIDQTDLAFSCLDEALAKEIVPKFREKGKLVIDNSSAYRQDPEVPLVVPEVNPEKIKEHKFIIANPNCSTIQMLVVLNPLHRESRIKRIFVATYQAVSGYGRAAVDELELENEFLAMGEKIEMPDDHVFPHLIAGNVIPQIGGFNDEGYTKEEMKLVNETRKILGDSGIQVTATCVRVPVINGHSEAVSVEFEQFIPIHLAKDLLRKAPGVKVMDGRHEDYPVPIKANGQDPVYVGRIRRDFVFENGLAMWIVADNIRKGAALNAVQIAELL